MAESPKLLGQPSFSFGSSTKLQLPTTSSSFKLPRQPKPATVPTPFVSSLVPAPSLPKRHSEYYLNDGNIVFKVENDLFRIHRYILTRESPVFRDMFTFPVPPEEGTEGTSDDNPIKLEQLKSADFADLLGILYERPWQFKTSSRTMDQWCTVLELTDKYQMDSLRAVAVDSLATLPLDPMRRITLSQRFKLSLQWALPGYKTLCSRATPLTLEEGRVLGVDTLIKIMHARENLRENLRENPQGKYYGGSTVISFSSPNPNQDAIILKALQVVDITWPSTTIASTSSSALMY